MSQFVQYLLTNGYAWSDTCYEDLKHVGSGHNDRALDVFNYIFAHNGFGFDFLYLFEPLTKEM